MLKFRPRDQGFLDADPLAVAPDDAPLVAIIPFGMEQTVSYEGGTSKGPQAMIEASSEIELFDEELWCEPINKFRVETCIEPEINSDSAMALDQLAGLTKAALDMGAFPFVFGGEHSITPGAIRPFVDQYDDLIILHFDAHADLRDGYNGDHYSHAAAMRRCLDNETQEIISIGIRNISRTEIPFLEDNRHRIHIHWAKDKPNWNIDDMLAPLKGRNIYLTFDVDGFDGSVMPATGTPEPGGLFWHDVMPIIKQAAQWGNIVGADINELAPRDGLHACDFLAAKLAYKILGFKFVQNT